MRLDNSSPVPARFALRRGCLTLGPTERTIGLEVIVVAWQVGDPSAPCAEGWVAIGDSTAEGTSEAYWNGRRWSMLRWSSSDGEDYELVRLDGDPASTVAEGLRVVEQRRRASASPSRPTTAPRPATDGTMWASHRLPVKVLLVASLAADIWAVARYVSERNDLTTCARGASLWPLGAVLVLAGLGLARDGMVEPEDRLAPITKVILVAALVTTVVCVVFIALRPDGGCFD